MWRVRINSKDGKIQIDDRPPPSPKKQLKVIYTYDSENSDEYYGSESSVDT